MRDITKMTYKIADQARESVRRDFKKKQIVIYYIDKESSYFEFRAKIIGRPIEIVRSIGEMKVVRFVNEEDRKNLNQFAGWSDNKREYLIDKMKFR